MSKEVQEIKITMELKDKVLAHLLSIKDPEPAEIEMSRQELVAELKDAIKDLRERKFSWESISKFCTEAGFPIPESTLRSYLSKVEKSGGAKKTKRRKKNENQDPAPAAAGQSGEAGALNSDDAHPEKKNAHPVEGQDKPSKEQSAKDRGFSSSAIEDKIKISDKF